MIINEKFFQSNETKKPEAAQSTSAPATIKQWEAATFKGDNDGRMTEKFKRLMGIKGDTAGWLLNTQRKYF